jgi:hypothetical protein
MSTITVGTRVHHAAPEPRDHREGIVQSVDSDGLLTVHWYRLSDSLATAIGATEYVSRMAPSILVAFDRESGPMVTKDQLTARKRGKGGTVLRLTDGRIVVVKDMMQRATYYKPDRIGVGSPDDGLAFGITLDQIAEIIS